MATGYKRPSDAAKVAMDLAREYYEGSLRLKEMEPHCPSITSLERIAEEVFYASLLPEESQREPLGVVYAPGGVEQLKNASSGSLDRWTTFPFEPLPLSAESLRKHGSLASAGRSYLVVTGEEELIIAGVALAPVNPVGTWVLDDGFFRVTATSPGEIWIEVAFTMPLAHLKGGEITPQYIGFGPINVSQAKGMFGIQEDNRWLLWQILRRVKDLRHGGILAVMGPDERASFDKQRVLKDPIRLAHIWGARPSKNTLIIEKPLPPDPTLQHLSGNEFKSVLNGAINQAARFTSVDGAVILNNDIELVAFGASLPDPKEPLPKKIPLGGRKEGDTPFELGARGTRHQGAAAFVANETKRVAFICSQDGSVGCFMQNVMRANQHLSAYTNKWGLEYWPISYGPATSMAI